MVNKLKKKYKQKRNKQIKQHTQYSFHINQHGHLTWYKSVSQLRLLID